MRIVIFHWIRDGRIESISHPSKQNSYTINSGRKFGNPEFFICFVFAALNPNVGRRIPFYLRVILIFDLDFDLRRLFSSFVNLIFISSLLTSGLIFQVKIYSCSCCRNKSSIHSNSVIWVCPRTMPTELGIRLLNYCAKADI